jgi:hypothetical protein
MPIKPRVPFARPVRRGDGLAACRFLPFKRAGFVCGRKSREDGIVIGRPFLNSCSDARASAPVDERSRPQIDPFRLPSLCGKACGDRMPGVTTALNVSLGNELCSPANNRAKIDASREYSGWWAGLALSHGAAITLGAYSPPPCSQNWQPNTAKWRNNASFWLPLLGTSKPKRGGSILRRSGCNLPY